MSSSPTPAAPVLPFFYYNPPYVATAVTALVLFAVLGAIATWNFVKEKPRSKTHINIIVFCVFRIVALGLRAGWAADYAAHGLAGFNTNLYLAASVAFSGGFFILLAQLLTLMQVWYSAVGKTEIPLPLPEWRVTGFLRLLSVGVTVFSIIGIVGGVGYGSATTQAQIDSADQLRSASAWGFVAVDGFIVLLSLFFAINAHIHGKVLVVRPLLKAVLPAAAVLVIRVIYTALMVDFTLQYPQNPIVSDQGFYPLSILPELIAVAILCVPGAVHDLVFGEDNKYEVVA